MNGPLQPPTRTRNRWQRRARLCFLIAAAIACGVALLVGHAAQSGWPTDGPDPEPRVVLPDESAYSASATDGLGTVTVTPTTVPVRQPVTLTFVYTAHAKGIAPGGGVLCNVSNFWSWTSPQNRSPQAPGYVTVRCSDAEIKLDISVDSGNNVIVVHFPEKPLRGGQTVTFVYGDTSGGRHPGACGLSDPYAERNERFFFKVDGDGDGWFTPLKQQPRFRVEAWHPAKLVVFGPSWTRVGKPLELTVAVLDATNNLVESYVGKSALEAEPPVVTCPNEITFKPDDRGALRVAVTATAPGIVRIAAADPAGKLASALSNSIIVSENPKPKYTLYWADLHGHCNVCDGTGSPEDYYRYARDVARLDIAALTDHDHWGYCPLDEDPDTWRRLCELSKVRNEPGRFVTFPGYEWTNWTFGHKHVLFLDEADAQVFGWHQAASDHPRKLWHLLRGRNCITIPHHPGGGPIPICWKYHDPDFEPVVEIASVHGVSECVGHPRCIYSPVASGMVQAALARGYQMGIVGSGDTHDGHPGIGSPQTRAGLAGIYATKLTRRAVFDALRARRVYATTGCRAILRFHLGDVPMGGVAELAAPGATRTLSVAVLGDGPIHSAEILKNNRLATGRAGQDETTITSFQWTDPAPAKNGDYYYARIRQADNHWIWSSPIFIKLAPPSRPVPQSRN